SVVWDLDHAWGDGEWMTGRGQRNALDAPIAIYEVHLGSWMRVPEEGGRPLSYREIAPRLADHVKRMGFSHVELMPVMEHPNYESWGYQITGFFAPTSRYGTPQDLMYLIDHLHQRGIAVVLDWVPFHFPADPHGLCCFDGKRLYEGEGAHPRWKTHVFNYGRPQVGAFMLSSALFWLDKYHADGLRVDAVSSMVYPDYPAEQEEPGAVDADHGPMNSEATAFLRRFNQEVYGSYPGVQTFAEDSKSIPLVTGPAKDGGLGFNMKWGLGWLHDTLDAYMTKEPRRRRDHHGKLTFPMLDLFKYNFVLSLSHDEVQPGKGSLLNKMPGDERGKFANVRLFLAYMYAYPGKKLIFMG
ncbi:MAG: alpha-amylase family glycosyl hydrolase, partial [Dehalococcoidia bacterium]|nr:alpha-amylase family glycosyl hydrolase [Dehalococcoidia bacterium]